MNNRQKVKMESYFNGKWVDDEDVVDLSMLDDDDAVGPLSVCCSAKAVLGLVAISGFSRTTPRPSITYYMCVEERN